MKNTKAKVVPQKKHDKRYYKRVIINIGIAATVLTALLSFFGVFSGLENRSIDWRFKMRGPISTEAPVTIVAIDDDSFDNMPGKVWPWPRSYHAKLVENLNRLGAKVIAFDIDFSNPKDPAEDKAFADAIKKAGNVILAAQLSLQVETNYSKQKMSEPIAVLKNAAHSLAHVNFIFDKDSVIRNGLMFYDYDDKRYMALGVRALGAYNGLKDDDLEIKGGKIRWGSEISIPLYDGAELPINFIGRSKAIKNVPYYRVFDNENLDPADFRDRIVLVGATADILHDVFLTPFSTAAEQMPGVEIHANMLSTIYSKAYINKMNTLSAFLLILALGLMTSFAIFQIKAVQGLFVIAAEIAAYIALAVYLFSVNNYLLELASPIAAMIISYLSISTYKIAVEERENRKIKSMFSKYVSPQLVNEILKAGELTLGGEKKEISVLFSDIRNFTAMSEKLEPEQVVHILNEYLSEMTEAIFENEGALDKFIGDAVMAVFGAPVHYENHAIRAVKTAFAMRRRLDALNEKWRALGKQTLAIGIGINTGYAIAGNMGSMKRMEYTVMGDTVNLASRLESLNKELGTEILISEETYNKVKDHVEAVPYTGVKVKGKEKAMTVYEITALKNV